MSTERSEDGLVRLVLIGLAIVILAPMLMMVFAWPMMGMAGMMGGMWGSGTVSGLSPWWGIGMMLVWLLVLVGIVYGGYRLFGGGRTSASQSDSALEELRLAYARGDLTDDEFERRRSRLQDTQRD
jgi:putative membrane protein